MSVANHDDVLLPETDTPGAHTAGVHHFIEQMPEDRAPATAVEMLRARTI